MKINGNGQARILTATEIDLLFAEGLRTDRDRSLFGVCLYTGCRISEALALRTEDIQGNVITLRKATTKGKIATRQIDMHPNLQSRLDAYSPKPGALFPGKRGIRQHLSRFSAEKILKEACTRVGLVGVSTHSFRRTALTRMSTAGIPLRTIQEISGHQSLSELQKYLEVSPDQKRAAINALNF
ncbi:MAG: site-specific integrase [Myxacorys californica WJT36-NPBG1]|jgi:integrase/recombinase XerD|nr:site-specific integrase [Myxacorys californica WJT36-NPBG1]